MINKFVAMIAKIATGVSVCAGILLLLFAIMLIWKPIQIAAFLRYGIAAVAAILALCLIFGSIL
ncbi:MAG: hypothetical protein IJ237_12100 [Oscillospiraceae bacterium]|nr:hypothetical protein [Oscillospiraceae bacterium]